MDVQTLITLLSEFPPNMEVNLYTGTYNDRGGEVWVVTDKFSLETDVRNILYLEGIEAH